MESGRYGRKLHRESDCYDNLQCNRHGYLGLYRHYYSNFDCKSIANGNSFSNSGSHLCWPEFDDCCQRSQFVHLEPKRLRDIVCGYTNYFYNI